MVGWFHVASLSDRDHSSMDQPLLSSFETHTHANTKLDITAPVCRPVGKKVFSPPEIQRAATCRQLLALKLEAATAHSLPLMRRCIEAPVCEGHVKVLPHLLHVEHKQCAAKLSLTPFFMPSTCLTSCSTISCPVRIGCTRAIDVLSVSVLPSKPIIISTPAETAAPNMTLVRARARCAGRVLFLHKVILTPP